MFPFPSRTKLLSILSVILIAALIICSYKILDKKESINKEMTNSGGKIKKISGSLVSDYRTLEEMKNTASVIIEGTVGESSRTTFGGVLFTISDIQVDNCLKGDFKKGEVIRLLETGGINEDGDEWRFEGIPVVKKNERYFLFLGKYEGPITENAYVPLAVCQGKFKITGKKVEQQAPDIMKLNDYPVTNIDTFRKLIETAVAE